MIAHVDNYAIRTKDILYIHAFDVDSKSNIKKKYKLEIHFKGEDESLKIGFEDKKRRDAAFIQIKERMSNFYNGTGFNSY